jgi:chemotaxis protein CheX
MEIKAVKEEIVKDIAVATETLFKTMVAVDLKYNSSMLAEETHIKTDISGLVSFIGKYHGIIGIFCSKKFSLKIASGMLMEEITEVTTDVIDTVGEVSNMIAGNVKTKITEDYGEMELSVPIVMIGNGATSVETGSPLVSYYTKEPWLLTNFISDGETFNVGLLLKEFVG